MSDASKESKQVVRLYDISDPDKLERIARETKFERVRETALRRAAEMRRRSLESEQSEKCHRCGAPLVNVEYYSASRGQGKVTNTRNDWDNMKKVVTVSTPYSDFHRHTAVFCPVCAARKIRRIHITSIAMMVLGVIGAILAGLVFNSQIEDKLRILIIAACILMVYVGYRVATEIVMYLPEGKGIITDQALARNEDLHNAMSARYVRTMSNRENARITREDGTNVVVGRGILRNKLQ